MPRKKKEIIEISKKWEQLRKTILNHTIEQIANTSHLLQKWIPVKSVFNKQQRTIPDQISPKAFSTIYKYMLELSNQTYYITYELQQHEGKIALMLRHKFTWEFFLYVTMIEKGHSPSQLLDISNRAISTFALKSVTPLEDLCNLHIKIRHSIHNDEADKFPSLQRQEERQETLSSINSNSSDNGGEKELLQFLLQQGATFTAQSFVKQVVNGERSFPVSFASQSKKMQQTITSVMADIVAFYGNKLTNTDVDTKSLITLLLKSRKVSRYILPNPTIDTAKSKKDAFQNNPIIQSIKNAIDGLGKSGQKDKEQLLSLLVQNYPQSWIEEFLGVGKVTVNNARMWADSYGPGSPQPSFAKGKAERQSRISDESNKFMLDWFRRNDNVTASPCVRRSSSTGKLMKHTTLTRVLNRNSGYVKFSKDAEKAGVTPVSRTHFYKMNKEIGIIDSKSDGGLCPNCHRYGTETYQRIYDVIAFMDLSLEKKKELKDTLDSIQVYFKRGGDFYYSLEQTSTCIDWCLRFNLSDPFDSDFQTECSIHDHEAKHAHIHTSRDPMIIKRESFFDELIELAYLQVNAAIKNMTFEFEKHKVVVKHMRNGYVTFHYNDENKGLVSKSIRWKSLLDDKKLTSEDLNNLALVDFIHNLKERHQKYIRHLYLDKNQTYGELVLMDSLYVAFLDYMMKLRGKSWLSDSSKFHLNMSKGTSVHVFSVQRKLTNDEMVRAVNEKLTGCAKSDLTKSDLLQKGDFEIIWIDTFCSNTTQGGYETFCVVEACTRKATEFFEDMKEISLVSDAGSGYKTAQSILGIRASKELCGCRVKSWLFNASGEGKRWQTDGHNTHIKARRDMAMRANQPADCTTPEKEALAQTYGGGVPGSIPYVLKFDYNNEVPCGTWSGIQNYHYFQFEDNGSITVWKTYGIGPGKNVSKAELDKMYKSIKDGTLLTRFPQGSTGATIHSPTSTAKEVVVPANHISKKRKMEDINSKIVERKEKRDKKENDTKLQKKAFDQRLGRNFFCMPCERGFLSKEDLDKHKCCNSADDQNEKSKSTNNVCCHNNTKGPLMIGIEDDTIFQSLDPTNVKEDEIVNIPMGRGLSFYRSANQVDESIRDIITQEVEKGNEKMGNRQSILEMHHRCQKIVPSFICPDVNAVQSIASGIMKKQKEGGKSNGSQDRVYLNEVEKRQDVAQSLSRTHSEKLKVKNTFAQQLIIAKYLGVCLIDDKKKFRVITGYKYLEKGKRQSQGWYVQASESTSCTYDDRKQKVLPNKPIICIKVGSQALGKYIKTYNVHYRSIISEISD